VSSGGAEIGPQAGRDARYQALSQAIRSETEAAVTIEAGKILSANANDPVALNALAMDHLRRGRPGAARLLLQRAIETQPRLAPLFSNLGATYEAEGEIELAAVNYKRALQIDDGLASAAANLGAHYLRGADHAKALPLLRLAHQANRSNVVISNNYAIALRGTGQAKEAAEIYAETLRNNTKDVALHLNYAILLIDHLNNPKEGLPLVYRVKFLETENKTILDRAIELEKKGRGGLQP
jgi:Flp pilus assembly protein TadD